MNVCHFGDCRDTLRRLSAEGVKAQMCVTSPPYFGLRDYGHEDQIGLEPTPADYIAAMVDVFRCVRNVLADDGVAWINLGDSYGPGKQLIGIPWRTALALQADGWILRQDIIWHKPNPMPESVTDRCTKAHEYIFLMSKSERYFFDREAMREESADPTRSATRYKSAFGGKKNEALLATDQVHTRLIGMREFDGNRNRRSVWSVATIPYDGAHFATFPPALIEPCILAGSRPGDIVLDPFLGSGTTAAVAIQHGRNWIGCELNPDYARLQNQRIRSASRQPDLFIQPAPVMAAEQLAFAV
jgi:DNA modification methylase